MNILLIPLVAGYALALAGWGAAWRIHSYDEGIIEKQAHEHGRMIEELYKAVSQRDLARKEAADAKEQSAQIWASHLDDKREWEAEFDELLKELDAVRRQLAEATDAKARTRGKGGQFVKREEPL